MADSTDDKDKKMSAARSAAITRLREAHLQEFNNYLIEETAARGIKWAPRKTAAEKAAEEFERLLQAHPELAERVNARDARDGRPDAGPDFQTGAPTVPDPA